MGPASAGRVARHEIRHLGRAIQRLFVYLYVPLTCFLVALHYPYSTDASVAAIQAHGTAKSASTFYEAAYRPTDTSRRGIDYEETAARAAKTYNIEGNTRDFVTRYRLEDKRVLEIGSGRGYLQDVVADYTGVDLSSKVAPYYHKPFVVGSATDLPFPDNAFDAAWTVWVVEHIPTPEKAFQEMRRVIKPGGLLLLMVAWNCPSWLADGFEARPYSDFNAAGKLVKASIPLRRTSLFNIAYMLPTRVTRLAHYQLTRESTSLRFRSLQPNYDVYWQADSDAAVSLDHFETMLWFESRGDVCLNCDSVASELVTFGKSLVIQIKR